ncbi:MAG: hypothetical protein L6Q97_06820 [Thermoanaerobaculia bacterium]|nr:hypothetical protein [Thermoanaerobaculia bacterium]
MQYVRWLMTGVLWAGCLLPQASAQVAAPEKLPLRITLFDNATLLPGGDEWFIWGLPVHPGISGGTEFQYRHWPHASIFQSAVVAYQYHRYVQHTIQLYSEFGYRYRFGWPLNLEARLGAGYLHAIPDNEIFKLENGAYVRKKSIGRPQLMAGLTLGAGFRVKDDWSILLAYQFYIQTPFVKSYVPVLPNTALHLGLQFPLFHRKKS